MLSAVPFKGLLFENPSDLLSEASAASGIGILLLLLPSQPVPKVVGSGGAASPAFSSSFHALQAVTDFSFFSDWTDFHPLMKSLAPGTQAPHLAVTLRPCWPRLSFIQIF